MQKYTFIWVLTFGFYGLQLVAQDTLHTKPKAIFSVGLGLQKGFIFAHTEEVQNTKGANPTGLDVFLSWQRNDESAYDLCRCYPKQGLQLSYYDFDVDILGKGLMAAYFLEPSYRLKNNLFFSFRGSLGLAYLTNPFDIETNPTNQSYSNHLSFYVALGLGFWFPVSDKLWLQPSINYNHISNGGLNQPNKGVNWPTAGLTLRYQPKMQAWFDPVETPKKSYKDYQNRYDVALFSTRRRVFDAEGNRENSFVSGLAFQGGRQVGSIHMLTLGAEVYYDGGIQKRLAKWRVQC